MAWWAQQPDETPSRRLSGELRRGQILDIALQGFGEHGYDAPQLTGMQAVARNCGISKAVLYRLFGDRLGLYRAAVAVAAERFVDIVTTARHAAATAPDARERARTFLLRLLDGIRQQPAVWFTITDRPRDAEAAAALAGAQARVRAAIIEGALADERERRPALTDRQVEWAARFLYGGLAEVLRSHLPEASAADDGALVSFLVAVAAPGAGGRSAPAGPA